MHESAYFFKVHIQVLNPEITNHDNQIFLKINHFKNMMKLKAERN